MFIKNFTPQDQWNIKKRLTVWSQGSRSHPQAEEFGILSKLNNKFAKSISETRTKTQRFKNKIIKNLHNSDCECSSCPNRCLSVLRGIDESGMRRWMKWTTYAATSRSKEVAIYDWSSATSVLITSCAIQSWS